ncbi:Por secretion system C-terminal sorting domain-containing protein [Dyadobacter koreensis]|uniref:Por secretion system C-terminal sorting domain-containing protein n=1 Tax=Dyadobacter koreensis TaxID=408657 RepID=A0A1H6QME3_9BACT|nr:DUF4347 domain-containing protein [Dyadobacter koreensis]SEI40600.1 Por secretion system C-terminal sorting domain-containing protein [Dyadobacter koreensis]
MKKNFTYLLLAGVMLAAGFVLFLPEQSGLRIQKQKNVVIIDKSLQNYQQLVKASAVDAQVILVENSDQGLRNLQAKISELHNISRIHILTHGTSGNLVLARQQLNEHNLKEFQGFWTALKKSFASEKSELMIYSCELASAATGKSFVDRLHEMLEIPVAGSEDNTGASSKGGNWDLEYTAGQIVKKHVLKFVDFQGLLVPSFTELTGSASPFYQIQIYTDDQLIYGDFDNDGDIDMHILPSLTATENKFYRNNGNGTFVDHTSNNNPFGSLIQKAVFGGANTAFVADWDNDGDVDVWTTKRDIANVAIKNIFYKNNAGVFQELRGTDSPFNGIVISQNIELIYGDFDNDGDIDIHSYSGSGDNQFFRNNGSGGFNQVTGAANPFNNLGDKAAFYSGAKYAHVADWDNDGDVDIFVTKYKNAGDNMLFRNDNGVFTQISGASSPFKDMVFLQDTQLVYGDFDADGDVDILGARSATAETLDFYRNNGSGTFSKITGDQNPFNTLPNTGVFLNNSAKAFVADWDNDKDIDVFTPYRTASAQNIFYRQTDAPPLLSSSAPANGATSVDIESNIVLNFNRAVSGVSGKNIVIKRVSDNGIVATIDATDPKVTGGGTASITINPASDFPATTALYVVIDKGAFKDGEGRIFLGITQNNVVAFTTGVAAVAPSVSTAAVSVLGTTSATLGGNVTNDGGKTVSDRGIVWNTSTDPTVANNKTNIGSGTGSFSQSVAGLPQGTRVYVRAYAINSKGTSYGSTVDFYTKTAVSSITRDQLSPTSALLVSYTVVFAQSVTGVDPSDFTLTTTGVSSAAVTGVSGSGTTYTVSVNTGSGNGTIRLDFTGLSGTQPTVNQTFTAADSYTIYKNSTASNYFRTKAANADWNQTGSWESSADNSFWISATEFPGATASSVNVLTGQTVNLPTGFNATAANLTNSGTINVNSSSLTVAGTFVNNGTLKGSGTLVHSSFTNGGNLAPGSSPGILSFTGNLVNSGTLTMEIGGKTPGTGYDQILVSGAMTMGGTLDVSFINGFTPSVDDEFMLIDAASSTGTFSTVNLPSIAPMLWQTTYNNAAGTLTLKVLADPLPVTLVDFDASKIEAGTFLNWSTSSESNSSHFEIQRSAKNTDWQTIGSVQASNESTSLRKYQFSDNSPLGGENLYRLKMIDKDQTFAFSRIRSVVFAETQVKISTYPNPVTERLFVDLKNTDEIASLQIYNLSGNLIYSAAAYSRDGIPVQSMASGLYVLKLTTVNNQSSSYKFLKN